MVKNGNTIGADENKNLAINRRCKGMININVNEKNYTLECMGTRVKRIAKNENVVGIEIGLEIREVGSGELVTMETLGNLGEPLEVLFENLVKEQKLSFAKK